MITMGPLLNPTRYDKYLETANDCPGGCWAVMDREDTGDWVHYEDFERLANQMRKLIAAARNATLSPVADGYRTMDALSIVIQETLAMERPP